MKWIKVKENGQLPDDLEDVLFTDGEEVFKGYKQSSTLGEVDFVYWHSISGSSIEDVTHWMPLPELPD